METNNTFNESALFYDHIYKSRTVYDEVDYVLSKITGILKVSSILEFGSGTGRHASLLVNRGYKVHGIERSTKMIERGVIDNRFTSYNGSIESFKTGCKYDAILAIFHVLSYITEQRTIEQVFNNANQHLNAGGAFLFDFWYTPAVVRQGIENRLKHLIIGDTEIYRFAESTTVAENIVEVKYTYIYINEHRYAKVFEEKHMMRHFTIPEIEKYATDSGFRIIDAEEWLTSANPSPSTWGVCMTLQKK
jgi:SAM-dependent methyltransferase